MCPVGLRLRRPRPRQLLAVATIVAMMLTGCGEDEPTPEASAQFTDADFDRTAYADAIAGGEVAVSAQLESPTDDGAGDVRVEVDHRPADATIRLAVSITRGAERVAFEVTEVGDRMFFRDGPANEDGEWITADGANSGADTPRVKSLLSAFPAVGDIAGSVRAEPCPESGACFVLTYPAFDFASLFVDTRTFRPVHMRLARPGMWAAGEIEIDWLATDPVKPPASAREVDESEFPEALAPVLQALGL